MDKIVFIDDGRIVDVGSHSELLARCDAYKTMVELQRLEDEDENENKDENKVYGKRREEVNTHA
jgi:ABC-type multidrug transport system ATPase subunit